MWVDGWGGMGRVGVTLGTRPPSPVIRKSNEL